ncbi:MULTISPECIES: carboxypeptidase-like regulatory domain-containing protein [Flavobacterium]|uniref:SusC/RagA family TonB-linked outer membrane protein n=1 Tax=Flavobacterium salmonis TaxID=2654844 RepID=A0A6V6Z6W6_9FLAO|nr:MULTISPECIES: carboxypeptidase-like regulatory domain-containing protein [Flavobacterium]OOV17718.1 hypothetical protein BXU10_16805 [Flavobacterium sp. LM4]CAD0007349.1 SusC/RagA family TonB-linked outer membrane protein [Flavobacterium salmonis]
MKKILLVLIFLFSILPGMLSAQDRTISGTVRGSYKGEPLPGVTIIATESGKSAVTDSNGKFSLSITKQDKLLSISYIGYETLEKNTGSSFNDIRLIPSSTALKEVLVVGYGTQSKKEFTGSAARITSKTIKDIPVQSFEQALIGKALE